jgi:hypothetical protein
LEVKNDKNPNIPDRPSTRRISSYFKKLGEKTK